MNNIYYFKDTLKFVLCITSCISVTMLLDRDHSSLSRYAKEAKYRECVMECVRWRSQHILEQNKLLQNNTDFINNMIKVEGNSQSLLPEHVKQPCNSIIRTVLLSLGIIINVCVIITIA